jgi:GntR family transcriptional regulator
MTAFSIDKASPIPLYYQIEEWIRGQIASGQLKPGDMLAPEIALSEELGVSRLTLRQALNNLTNDGLLIRKRAKGTFIAPQRNMITFQRDQLLGVTDVVGEMGFTVHSRVLEQTLIPAAGTLMRELRLSSSEQVILIRRLRSAGNEPIVIETTCHPYQLFPELLDMDLNDRSIYAILEEMYEARPHEALDSFVASVASKEEARLLEIEEGAPVMRFQRTGYSRDGAPMEFTRSVYRADRYQFVVRYHRSEAGGAEQLE